MPTRPTVERSSRREGVLLLTKQVPWHGAATGYYGMLPPALRDLGAAVRIVTPRSGLLVRMAGKVWSWRNRLPRRHQSLAYAEWEFVRQFERQKGPGVILALEDFLPLLSLRRFGGAAPERLVGVIHYPPALWTEAMLDQLRCLRSALVLYRADIPFFERLVGSGRVKFVPHGVDVRRFSPAASATPAELRLLVVGQFGRDFGLLARAFAQVREKFPTCRLDIVGAHHARHEPIGRQLAATSGVELHGVVTDEELVGFYRRATVVLMPLQMTGANNALVEALACGAAIVGTDVGGMPDYGGGGVFPVVPPGDADSFAKTVIELLRDRDRRRALGSAARQFTLENLTWESAAQGLCEALQQLTGTTVA